MRPENSETDVRCAASGISPTAFYSHLWGAPALCATGREEVPLASRLGAALVEMISIVKALSSEPHRSLCGARNA